MGEEKPATEWTDPRDRLLTLDGVARMLGVSTGVLHRHARELRERHNFPRPVPLLGRYDPQAVRDWLAQLRGVAVAPPRAPDARTQTAAEEENIRNWQDVLNHRLDGIAQGKTGKKRNATLPNGSGERRTAP